MTATYVVQVILAGTALGAMIYLGILGARIWREQLERRGEEEQRTANNIEIGRRLAEELLADRKDVMCGREVENLFDARVEAERLILRARVGRMHTYTCVHCFTEVPFKPAHRCPVLERMERNA